MTARFVGARGGTVAAGTRNDMHPSFFRNQESSFRAILALYGPGYPFPPHTIKHRAAS